MKYERITPFEGDHIEIAGAGGNVNFPMALVQAALELGGYEVQVVNDCGQDPKDYWFVDKEEYKKFLTGELPWSGRRSKKKPKVQLVAKHIPWGG